MSESSKKFSLFARRESDNDGSELSSTPSIDSTKSEHARVSTHATSIGYSRGSDAFLKYRRTFLSSFFGSNEPEPYFDVQKEVHPCKIFSKEVHQCLNTNANNYLFCQSRVAAFQRCMDEYRI
ncbi:unnamed protein product [Phytomonas sp. Hart1]|nr:unnamed protein product [Phytomonas sp. Hart1]|eukprot:CCW67729.1 unnamed protein product [Phytomonas sp. isolate Hart1]